MAERWTPDSWRKKPIQQVPDYPDRQALADVEKQLATFPPLVFAGEARSLKKTVGACRQGRGFPAARRRLRGKFCRAWRQQHPRLFPHVPANGGGADLCRRFAGGEGRPHCRPVRQAALLADREARRQGTAELPRRHHQRHRFHRGGAPRRIRAGRSRPIASRLRRSICCVRSRKAAMPISPACGNGCSASSRIARSRGAMSNCRIEFPRRLASCRPAASIWRAIPNCAPPISTPATRRCCSASRRQSPASIRPPATGTRHPATCCGSAIARGNTIMRISNTRAASRIPSD